MSLFNLADAITSHYLKVSPETPLTTVIGRMYQTASSAFEIDRDPAAMSPTAASPVAHTCAVVFEADKVVGIVTERDVVKLAAEGVAFDRLTAAEAMNQPVITYQWRPETLSQQENPVFEVLALLKQHHIRHLLVVDEADRPLGLVTPEQVRALLNPMDMLRMRTIDEVMSPEVVYLSGETSLLAVARCMTERWISCVVIAQEQDNVVYPLGIITERDIVQFKGLGLDLAQHSAANLMSTPLFTLRPQDSLWQANQVMQQRRLRRMVIVDDRGALVGILTQTNLLKLLEPNSLYEINWMLQQRLAELEAEKNRQLAHLNQTLQTAVAEATATLDHQLRREKLIFQISQRIRSSLNLQAILDVTVAEIRSFLNCDRVMLYQFAADWSGVVVAESVDAAYMTCLYHEVNDTYFQNEFEGRYPYRLGQVSTIDDIDSAGLTDCHRKLLEHFQIRANLVVPVVLSQFHANGVGEEPLWGLLVANQCDRPRQWLPSEVEILQELSGQLAIAIQHANAHIQLRKQLAERQHIESTLRQSEQNYASLTEAVPVGIFRTDEEGLCLYVNERWCQIAGLSLQEALGFGWVQAIHPDDRERVTTAWTTATLEQHPFQLEYRFQSPQGQVTWVYGQAIAEQSDNGEVVGYVGTITDISHRKQAEAKNRAMLKAMPDLMFQVNGDGVYLTYSLGNREIDILAPDADPVGRSITDLLPPEIAQRHLAAIQLALQTNRLQRYEQQFELDDRLRYEEVRVIKSGDNEALFIVRDITDRRTAELAVYESEERLRLALSAANQGLYDLNLKTGEAVVTPEYATMLGYDPTNFQETNATWIERLHPDDRDTVARIYQAYVAGDILEYKVEFRQLTQSGVWKWILSLGKIVDWDGEGQPLRMLGTHTDIDDRKAAEQALATQRDFNQLIAELTSRFVYLKPETLGIEIESTLQRIGEFIQVEASYIFQFARDGQSMSMIHEWCAPGIPYGIVKLQAVPLAVFPWSTGIYQQGDVLNVPSLADLPPEATIDQASWQTFNVKAVLSVPLIRQTEVIGFMGFALFSQERIWSEEIIRLLQIVSQTITSAQERLQAEQALRKREIQFRQVVENIQDMFFTYDYPALKLRYASPMVEAVTGYPARALYADADLFFRHIHADDRALVQAQFTDNPWDSPTNFEYRWTRSTGETRWIHIKLFPLKTELGDVHRLIGVGRDITDRKQAEQAHLQAEKTRLDLELLENVLDTVLAGYWHTDIPGQRQYISPGFKRMFGYEDAELSNSPDTWKTLILPEDLPKALANFQQHVQSRGNIPYYNELRYRHKNGSTVWVICAGRVIEWDEAGNPLRMIGCHFDITQQKQAEEELRATKEEFERFFNGALDLFCIAGMDGCFRRLNRAWESTLGYSLAELEGQSFLDFVHPDDREATLAAVSTLDDQQLVMGFVNRYRCKDGSYRDIEWYSRPYGQLIYAAARDITERRQAEAWLIKSDAHLKAAQRIGKLGSWEFQIQTGAVTWSEEVFRIFGLDPQLGPPSLEELQQLLHPEDRAMHQQTVETAIATVQPYELEFRAYRPDGSLVYTQARGEPIVDASGQVIQLVGTVLDITERKLAEQQIQDQTDRLTLATRSAAIGIWDWNVTQNVLDWDDRMYELYGLTRETFSNAYAAWANSLHPDDRVATEAAIQQALAGEKDYDPEFRIVHPDGTVHFIKAYALVQRNPQGDPQRMIGINLDITDRKQVEEQIRQTSAQLEASNRELEAFAYSVSHDLRAPLRAIDGFSKALLEDYGTQLDEEAIDYFNRIRNNVQRMGMLIDDLLRLSRVSRSEMQYTTVNLSALVEEQANELKTTEPDRCVTFVVAPDVVVSADLTLMQVVLDNLLRNAWKFTSHHTTARIEFGVTQIQDQPTYFVRDDGAGFDMTYANMLFRVFQRLHNTHEFPGTGIGLATVQRAIHRHGGQVWAEGAVEQGATVYFTLPKSQ